MEDDFRIKKRDFNHTWVPRIIAAVEELDLDWDTIRLDCPPGLPMRQRGNTPYITGGRSVFRTAYLNNTPAPADQQCGYRNATGPCWYAGGGYATIYRCSSVARVAREVLRWPLNDYDGALCTRNLRNYCVNWGLVTGAPIEAVGLVSDRDPDERRRMLSGQLQGRREALAKLLSRARQKSEEAQAEQGLHVLWDSLDQVAASKLASEDEATLVQVLLELLEELLREAKNTSTSEVSSFVAQVLVEIMAIRGISAEVKDLDQGNTS